MIEYERLRLAGEIVQQGLQKEAGPIASITTPLLSVQVASPYHRKKRKSTRRKAEASRVYFDTETRRFI